MVGEWVVDIGVFLLFVEVRNNLRKCEHWDYFLQREGTILWVLVLLCFLHHANRFISALLPCLYSFTLRAFVSVYFFLLHPPESLTILPFDESPMIVQSVT